MVGSSLCFLCWFVLHCCWFKKKLINQKKKTLLAENHIFQASRRNGLAHWALESRLTNYPRIPSCRTWASCFCGIQFTGCFVGVPHEPILIADRKTIQSQYGAGGQSDGQPEGCASLQFDAWSCFPITLNTSGINCWLKPHTPGADCRTPARPVRELGHKRRLASEESILWESRMWSRLIDSCV